MSFAAARPWFTLGVGLAGTALIAAAPVTSPEPMVKISTIELTAAEFDPITPWIDVVDHTADNLGGLFDHATAAPLFPVLQQVAMNQIGYANSLLNGSGDLGTILTAMGDNAQSFFGAPFAADWDLLSVADGTISGSILGIFDGSWPVGHDQVFDVLHGLSTISPTLKSLVEFTASPLSGLLLGSVGPVIGPALAFGDGIQAAVGHLSDPLSAVNDLVNIPAHMADAFLNGGPSLSALTVFEALGLPTELEIAGIGDFSLAKASIDALGLTMGGVLSPEGSLFNALDFTGSAGVLNIGGWSALSGVFDLPGNEVGALGTLIGLPETLASSIGWDGSGLLDELLGGSLFSASPTSLFDFGLAELLQQPLTDAAQFLGSDLAELLGGDIAGLLGNGLVGDLSSVIPSLLLSVLG
ncbi:hypothetical protein BHQ15_00575 [Mycolicibacillus koreensis]|nr:hypothetical protein BHQ15_00575 [Mycolicibacillus koreensis]